MDFIDQLQAFASKVNIIKGMILTEEATKNSMVMPLIKMLGYDPFDPLEVTPELVADVGTKKGEKVDYAILSDGKPIMLFECKKAGAELNINHASQLFRYFHVTAARFGVLTNGLTYKFFTDLEQPNKMDEKPFFEFNILDFKERDVDELKKFAKTSFDLDTILTTASDLKYTRAIQNRLSDWITVPPEEFVRLVSTDLIGSRRFTPAVKEQFTAITKRAFEQLIGERINERLKGAMTFESAPAQEKNLIVLPSDDSSSSDAEDKIVTTPDEIEGFHIIQAILRGVLIPRRIFMRDAKSYCAILLDDNNRKTICRLRFNSTRLSLGFFNEKKEEVKVMLDSLDDIYKYAEQLTLTVASYIATEEV